MDEAHTPPVEIFAVRDRTCGAPHTDVSTWLAKLQSMLPFCDVHEVGSTAIAGVIGKQDIDFLVRCDAANFANACAMLDSEFERNPTQFSSAEFQGYRIASNYDVAIQVTVRGCVYDDFLDFMERVRSNAELIDQYNALKREWHGHSMDAYRKAKAAFVRRVLDDTHR